MLKKIDDALSILQRLVVIAAASITGWYVLLRQDNTVHSLMSLQAAIGNDCTLAARIEAKNPKGVIVAPESVALQVFRMNTAGLIKKQDNNLLIAEQVRSVDGQTKVGEVLGLVLAVPLPSDLAAGEIVSIRAQMTLPNSVVYNDETYLETKKCEAA